MIVSHEREKLIHAIVFFAQNTRYCGKIKLIKLLYLLDFEHFRQTGRSVTGMDYRAWKMGPVPFEFYQEFDALEPDLAAAIDIAPEKIIDYTRELIVAKVAFDDSHFTKRELRVMGDLAARFRDSLSKPMVDVTHEELGPWAEIWDGGRGNDERIPYRLALAANDPHREAILASADEYVGLEAAQTH
ncbi:MAG: SocA family protein [Proteobacteria bacterium]|nr:SocA family protein [Pseudomonadota bacterium]